MTGRVIPPESPDPLEQRAPRVGTALREVAAATAAALELALTPGITARGASERLGVGRRLAWHALTLARASEPFEMARARPGRRGWQTLLAALERTDARGERLDRLRQAVDRLHAAIDEAAPELDLDAFIAGAATRQGMAQRHRRRCCDGSITRADRRRSSAAAGSFSPCWSPGTASTPTTRTSPRCNSSTRSNAGVPGRSCPWRVARSPTIGSGRRCREMPISPRCSAAKVRFRRCWSRPPRRACAAPNCNRARRPAARRSDSAVAIPDGVVPCGWRSASGVRWPVRSSPRTTASAPMPW